MQLLLVLLISFSLFLSMAQTEGATGAPVPWSSSAGRSELAAGSVSALHLHHCLLQHLEGG